MIEADLTDLLREHAQRHRIPGAVVGVVRDGVAAFACHGVANAGTRAPVTRKSLFGAGSLTKSMVASVVARLADDGRLRLDDPVAARVPELHGVAWAESATVRDLLANRSGLPLDTKLELDFAAQDGLSSFAARVAAHEPTPVAWSYTNAGWCLLGRAVETATGLRWEEALRANLLEPAEMRETSFATEAVSADRVSGHGSTSDGPAPVEPLVSRTFGPAGASVVSTVGDMLRFAALHLDDPGLARLRELQAEPRIHGWLDGWCLGWARFDWDGGPVWGWDSVLPGERAVLRLVPEQRAAVVLMANSDAGRALYRSLFGELFPSLFGVGMSPTPEALAGAAGDLSRFAGVYGWADRRVEVTAQDGHLLVDGVEAVPVDNRVFLADPLDPDEPTFTFDDPDDHGRPRVVYDTLWAFPRLA